MRGASLSIAVWGAYMMVAGLGFIVLPNILLPVFGLPTTTEVWVRVTGLLVAIFGAIFFSCARNNDVAFFRLTVPARIAFAVGLAAFVALGMSGPTLLIFGVLDVIGAIWTWLALRSTAAAQAAA
jgi:hypothetical protein